MNLTRTDVVVAILLRDEHICVGQRKKDPFKGFFECPGGKVEVHESLEDALHRELYEEGHLKIQSFQYLTHYDVSNPHGSFRLHWFKVEPLTDFEPIIYDAVGWVKLEDLPQLNWIEHNRPYLPLLMQAQTLPVLDQHFELSAYTDQAQLLIDLEASFKDARSYKKSVSLSLGNTSLDQIDTSLLDFIHLYPIKLLP